MEYNIKKIGERIHKLRKEMPNMTMEELASAVGGITRQTVSKWEKGEGEITINDLVKLCKIFNCDMGYLLCEYEECKTRDLQFIHDVTGLSEETIRILESWNTAESALNTRNGTRAKHDKKKTLFIEKLIKYRPVYLLSDIYDKLQKEKAKYDNRESEYRENKERLDSIDMGKDEFFDMLYSDVRECSFKALMEFQRFLDK